MPKKEVHVKLGFYVQVESTGKTDDQIKIEGESMVQEVLDKQDYQIYDVEVKD